MQAALFLVLLGVCALANAKAVLDPEEYGKSGQEAQGQGSSTFSTSTTGPGPIDVSITSSPLTPGTGKPGDMAVNTPMVLCNNQNQSAQGQEITGGAKPKAFCTREYRPVCGSNAQTYNNKCEFENAQASDPSLKLNHDGAC